MIKLKDLVHGKYYCQIDESGDTYHFRFDRNGDMYTYNTGYFICNGCYEEDNEMFFYHNDIFEEISIEEIIKYLPNDHIERFHYCQQKLNFLLNIL